MKPNENEQWKPGNNGVCNVCRRQRYCGSECRNHKAKVNSIIRNKVVEIITRGKGDEK